MTCLVLAPWVHAVAIGRDLVLLDTRADRYHCLPDGAALGLSADRRRLQACSPAVRRDLAAAGLAHPHPPPGFDRPAPPWRPRSPTSVARASAG